MGTFRRVEADQAGPTAVGILVPPAKRTFVIVRPRALPWDLVLCQPTDDLTFQALDHSEASAMAQAIHRALREWSEGGMGGIESIAVNRGAQWLRLRLNGLVLLVCSRNPGQPYAPLTCPPDESPCIIDRLTRYLCPAAGVEQEVYFNVRFFER